MIRILHVIGSLDMGGSQMFVLNLYNHIDRTKIQFDFVVREGKNYFLEDKVRELGGKIYKLPALKFTNYLTYVSAWKKFFKEHHEYKIVHGHIRSTAVIYLKIAKNFGLKTISHSHSTRNNSGISAFVKAVLQYPIRFVADYFFACSKDAGEWLFGKKITHQANFFVVPNAIDTAQFAYNPATRSEMRQKLNIENNFVVGHVGRLDIPKNHTFLLKVFAEVYKQNSNARLLLLGEGPLKKNLIQQTEQLHISQAVFFCGNQPAENYYQAMDVIVFPSIYEGLPVTLVEAQTSGLPCLIADHITQEVDLEIGLITRLSLRCSPAKWAEKVLMSSKKNRQSYQIAASQKGFDVAVSSKWMMGFYMREGV